MIISIINHSRTISDKAVQEVIRAIRWEQPVYGSDKAALERKKIKSQVTAGRIYRRLHLGQP